MNELLAHLNTRVPARYVPFAVGRYEVKAGLHRFGTGFGNGRRDRQIFQFDRAFAYYRSIKLAARAECLDRYVATREFAPDVEETVVRFIVERLVTDHPRYFHTGRDGDWSYLDCGLVGERLVFDGRWRLVAAESLSDVTPRYACAFDALASVIQEDLAVTSVAPDRHWLSAVHVCLPSYWSPRQKIGGTFAQVHKPVAGMEAMNRHQQQYVDQMVRAENGLVRFVWGLQTDNKLNRQPDGSGAPAPFDPGDPRAFVRVERQTIWGLPAVGASLFTIRPYLMDVNESGVRPDERRSLVAALRSMTSASVDYKGLSTWRDDLVAWLEGLTEKSV